MTSPLRPSSGAAAAADARAPRLRYLADLLVVLVGRDIKLRYKRSAMGLAWTLLNPLAELLVLWFVFRVVLPIDTPNYTAFLFIGILIYGWFQASLLFAAGSVVGGRELIRQPGFPPAILPVVTVTSSLIHLLLAFPILAVLLAMSDVRIGSTAFWLPAVLAVQYALTLSFSYLVAALHVRFRDTQYLLKVTLQFLFYLSPVFYPASAVPVRLQGVYQPTPGLSGRSLSRHPAPRRAPRPAAACRAGTAGRRGCCSAASGSSDGRAVASSRTWDEGDGARPRRRANATGSIRPIGPAPWREAAARGFRRKIGSTDTFWALKDVTFGVGAGRTLGVIGANGSGKSPCDWSGA
ncbi:MAG: ABC transporter permease [Gemmatimonadales bacterium]